MYVVKLIDIILHLLPTSEMFYTYCIKHCNNEILVFSYLVKALNLRVYYLKLINIRLIMLSVSFII